LTRPPQLFCSSRSIITFNGCPDVGFARSVNPYTGCEFDTLRPYLDAAAHRRAAALRDAHSRARLVAHLRGVSYRVEPQLPPEVLSIYVYLPVT